MEFDRPDEIDALWGPEAIRWLFGRKEGGSFLDGALAGVEATFGIEAGVSALVPLSLRSEPTDFFFQVKGSAESDADWSRLVGAHEVLIREGAQRRSKSRFENLHLVLEPDPVAPVPLASVREVWLQ